MNSFLFFLIIVNRILIVSIVVNKIFSFFRIYCYAFRPRSRERLLYQGTFGQFDCTMRKLFHFSATMFQF